jgi:hypothetical protein
VTGYDLDNDLLLAACAALAVLIGLAAGLLLGLAIVLLDRRKIRRWKAKSVALRRPTVKLVLILVRVLNPLEEFCNAELAILMSVGKNRVSEILTDKHFLQVVNR